MNQEEFIKIIKRDVAKASAEDVIHNLIAPIGRKPSGKLLKLSNFYNSIDDKDKVIIHEIIYEAIDAGIFGFLCVIDGVRSIRSDTEESHLRLSVINNSSGEEVLLNDQNKDFLHDIYNAE